MMEKERTKQPSPSLIQSCFDWDLFLSKKFAFCANDGKIRPAMMLLELSGHGIPWLGGCILALFVVQNNNVLKEVLCNFIFALVIDLVFIAIVKGTVRRNRPSYNKSDMFATVHLDKYSFPSGHATRSAMMAILLITHFKFDTYVKYLLICWMICTGLSRVVLGRHHFSDVICGFVIGYMQYCFVEVVWFNYESVNFFLLEFQK